MPDVSPAEAMPPPIRLLQCEPDMREPGTMLFNVRLGGAEASSRSVTGWLLALDRTGRGVRSAWLPHAGAFRAPPVCRA